MDLEERRSRQRFRIACFVVAIALRRSGVGAYEELRDVFNRRTVSLMGKQRLRRVAQG